MDTNKEYEPPQENSHVEIINIPELDDASDIKAILVRSRLALASRFSPRQRVLQLIVTISIVVVALLVVLGNTMPIHILATGLFFGPMPSPTATLAPGADLFYIRGNPSWGDAFIDGHQVAHLPTIGVDPPLQLARGHHALMWRAEPFPAQSCTISVPPIVATDSCIFNDSVQLKSGLNAWIITLSVSLAMLSDSQRAALIHAAQIDLDAQKASDTVQLGELYSNGNVARQPLQATLHFQLDADPASNVPCSFGNVDGMSCSFIKACDVFCLDPKFVPSSAFSLRKLNVFAAVRSMWDYAMMNGQRIALNQPDASAGAVDNEHFVLLQIEWHGDGGGWSVSIPPEDAQSLSLGNLVCGSAQDEVRVDPSLFGVSINNAAVQWQFASGSNLAAGCIAVASPAPAADTTSTPSASPLLVAYCLHRFGIFLAANDLAHQLWPYMPLVDGYERSLVQHIIASSGVVARSP